MRTRHLLAVAALLIAPAACATEESADPVDDAASSTSEPQPTAESPTVSGEADAFAALRGMDHILAVTESEPGRLEVETDLVDPQGDGGSAEARSAAEICEAAVALLGDEGVDSPYVAVLEEDGTHWILHGHPSYSEPCTEI